MRCILHLQPLHRRQRRHLLLFILHNEKPYIVFDTWILLLQWLHCTKNQIILFCHFLSPASCFSGLAQTEVSSRLPNTTVFKKIQSVHSWKVWERSRDIQQIARVGWFSEASTLEASGDKPLKQHASPTGLYISVLCNIASWICFPGDATTSLSGH